MKITAVLALLGFASAGNMNATGFRANLNKWQQMDQSNRAPTYQIPEWQKRLNEKNAQRRREIEELERRRAEEQARMQAEQEARRQAQEEQVRDQYEEQGWEDDGVSYEGYERVYREQPYMYGRQQYAY